MSKNNWRSAVVSEEAWKLLKVASVLAGKEMRDMASVAIISYCLPYTSRKPGFQEKRKPRL